MIHGAVGGVVLCTRYTPIHSPGVSIHHNAHSGKRSLVSMTSLISEKMFLYSVTSEEEASNAFLMDQYGHLAVLTSERLLLRA